MRPSATTSPHGNKSRKALSTGMPADRSDLVGVRLLSIPRCESNECHGNAFHSTNWSGFRPSRKRAPHTIVPVGSEKPSEHFSHLLVRCGVTLKKICVGLIPLSFFLPSRIRSEVIGIPVK